MSTVPAPRAAQNDAGPSTNAPRLKLVVRRLPPTLPEELFWKTVEPWVNDETCGWRRYVKGRTAESRLDAHAVHSRAYVLMSSPATLVEFTRKFSGHVFRSKQGAEYRTVVEFAPVQKTPSRTKAKADARQGTIDDDPDYLAFLEQENAPPEKPVVAAAQPIEQPTTTPLLEHLRQLAKSGKGAKKAKAKSGAPSVNELRREAALTSISRAAKQRAPSGQAGQNAQGEGTMRAGKGRDLAVTEGATAGETKEGGGRKRNRGRKKAAAGEASAPQPEDSAATTPAPAATSTPAKAARQGVGAAPAAAAAPNPGPSAQPSVPKGDSGRGRGNAQRGRGGPARGAAVGGSSRGRGGGPAPDRTAHGAIVQVLARNAEGDARGGGRGRGRGAGRGAAGGARGGAGASADSARIDA